MEADSEPSGLRVTRTSFGFPSSQLRVWCTSCDVRTVGNRCGGCGTELTPAEKAIVRVMWGRVGLFPKHPHELVGDK